MTNSGSKSNERGKLRQDNRKQSEGAEGAYGGGIVTLNNNYVQTMKGG